MPWQENAQPSQPRQLGYSQGGDGKMEGCSAVLELGELWKRRGPGDESGTRCFILFWYRKDMAFAVFDEKTKHRLVTRASCLRWPAVMKFIIWWARLEGASSVFNYVHTF